MPVKHEDVVSSFNLCNSPRNSKQYAMTKNPFPTFVRRSCTQKIKINKNNSIIKKEKLIILQVQCFQVYTFCVIY